jgi:hypothetical protein
MPHRKTVQVFDVACQLADAAELVSGNTDQFGEGLSILSITITSTTALVG